MRSGEKVGVGRHGISGGGCSVGVVVGASGCYGRRRRQQVLLLVRGDERKLQNDF